MSMLSNLDLILRVPLFAMLTASQAESLAGAHSLGARFLIGALAGVDSGDLAADSLR